MQEKNQQLESLKSSLDEVIAKWAEENKCQVTAFLLVKKSGEDEAITGISGNDRELYPTAALVDVMSKRFANLLSYYQEFEKLNITQD